MKRLISLLTIVFTILLISTEYYSQDYVDTTKTDKKYVITTNDGGVFIGTIIQQDSREVLILTEDKGEVAIPKYQIKTMEELDPTKVNSKGEYVGNEVFSTRYFITTNGLPIEKGENYIQWNLYGPDIQFGVGKNFGVGVMTSWLGMPIIGTLKYSIPVNKNLSFGAGALLGTGSWVSINSGGILPFGVVTIGDRKTNLNLSGGYVAISLDGDTQGRGLFSIAGMAKVGKSVSLVFDSFIMAAGGYRETTEYNPTTGNYETVMKRRPGGALLLPGVRLQMEQKSAFQFGFGGLVFDGELVPFPVPMVQWFRKI